MLSVIFQNNSNRFPYAHIGHAFQMEKNSSSSFRYLDALKYKYVRHTSIENDVLYKKIGKKTFVQVFFWTRKTHNSQRTMSELRNKKSRVLIITLL